jgi:hypothetical protein
VTWDDSADRFDVEPLVSPLQTDLGLFVYGALRPGELGYDQLAETVASSVPGSASGALRVLDGLPVLDMSLRGVVDGDLLSFNDPAEGYRRVCMFEPSTIYRWTTAAVRVGTQTMEANALVAALRPDKGGDVLGRSDGGDVIDRWTMSEDPLLVYGLPTVGSMARDHALVPFVVVGEPSEWQRFYRVQAAFLLACSVLERIAFFTVGARLKPTARVHELGKQPTLKAAAREAGVTDPHRAVGRSDRPADRRRARPGGAGFIERTYLIRSNLMHRGKSAYREAELVRTALLDLHDTLHIYLTKRSPQLSDAWSRTAADEPERLGRIKPQN